MNDSLLATAKFQKGERIITAGTPATTAYMIDKGNVRVFLEKDGKIIDLATLGENEIFGESSLFDEAKYGAHVEAEEETELTLITPEILSTKMESCDFMIKAVIQMLLERLRKTNEALLRSETREHIDVGFV